MKKSLVLFLSMMLLVMTFTGCSMFGTPNVADQVFKPIPSKTYVQTVAPMVKTVFALYGSSLKPDMQSMVQGMIAEMDKAALTTDTINVFPVLVATATPIVLKKADINLDSITQEQAIAASLGLELLHQSYMVGENKSQILESIYPILKDVLDKKLTGGK